jgi:hypothetical protein
MRPPTVDRGDSGSAYARRNAAALLKRRMLGLSDTIDGRGEEELPEIVEMNQMVTMQRRNLNPNRTIIL